MKLQESANPGYVLVDCLKCGRMYEIEDFRHKEFREIVARFLENGRRCPDCEAADALKHREEENAAYRLARQRRIGEILSEAGLPAKYQVEAPPVPYVADWIRSNRQRCILLSGPTGSGKSTSAGFVLREMLADQLDVRYLDMRKLLDQWKDAKCSEWPHAVDRMIRDLFALDYLVIDECVGKEKISLSGQELLFALLEGVNSGECRAKLWLLGNFYSGSIEDIFGDPDPVRRRLQENFAVGIIREQRVSDIQVWRRAACQA